MSALHFDCQLIKHSYKRNTNLFIHTDSISITDQTEQLPEEKIPFDQISHFLTRKSTEKKDFPQQPLKIQYTALELFTINGNSILLNFENLEKKQEFEETLLKKDLPNLNRALTIDPIAYLHKTLLRAWQQHELSNFDYLMWLNLISNRSTHDIFQYTIFPWVISDYKSETLDLSNPRIYRDLAKPVGALDKNRLLKLQSRFEHQNLLWDESQPIGVENSPPFLYSNFCSHMSRINNTLQRTEHGVLSHIELQNMTFDSPDRLFFNILVDWKINAKKSEQSFSELHHEFFSCPDFLRNKSQLNFGKQQNGDIVDDVILPPWANSPEAFIRIQQEALESPYVSEHLHQWIDLIFGYQQQGEEAKKVHNVLHYLRYYQTTDEYPGFNDLDEEDQELICIQLEKFGSVPYQLFHEPHPKRFHETQLKKNNPISFKKIVRMTLVQEETSQICILETQSGNQIQLTKEDKNLILYKNYLQQNLLHIAIEQFIYDSENQEENKALITWLATNVRNKQLLNAKDSQGKTPLNLLLEQGLYNEISIEIFNLLIDNGANINTQNSNGETPLHHAAKNSDYFTLTLLLDRGANVDAVDFHKNTPLYTSLAPNDPNTEISISDIARCLLEYKANPNLPNDLGRTPLHFLLLPERRPANSPVSLGCLKDLIIRLIQQNANINAQDMYGKTPLHYAIEQDPTNLDLFIFLIDQGADPNFPDNHGKTALHLAIESNFLIAFSRHLKHLAIEPYKTNIRKNLVRCLIQNGASPNTPDNDGKTPFIIAAAQKKIEIVTYLCKQDPDILDQRDQERNTNFEKIQEIGALSSLMHWAIKRAIEPRTKDSRSSVDFVKLFFLRVSSNIQDSQKKTPLHLVVESEQKNLLRFSDLIHKLFILGPDILTIQDAKKKTALHIAVEQNNIRLATVLLNLNPTNVTIRNHQKQTPLDLAILNNNEEIIELLHPLIINQPNPKNQNPLHLAAAHGQIESVKYWANIYNFNDKDDQGQTPLHLAAKNGHIEVVRFLIENGATINEKNNEEQTPIHLAIEDEQQGVFDYLFDEMSKNSDSLNDNIESDEDIERENRNASEENHDLDLNLEFLLFSTEKKKIKTISSLLQKKLPDSLQIPTNEMKYPLHSAAANGQIDRVKYLIEQQVVDIQDKDQEEQVPLHLAIINGHIDVFNYLIENNANLHIQNKKKQTPLHLAAANNQLEMVKILIRKGANLQCKDNEGKTPLHLAAENGHQHIIQTLEGTYTNHFSDLMRNTDPFIQQFLTSTDNQKNTPLHLAIANDQIEATTYLIQAAPKSLNCQNAKGKRPLDLISTKKQAKRFIQRGIKDLRLTAKYIQFCLEKIKYNENFHEDVRNIAKTAMDTIEIELAFSSLDKQVIQTLETVTYAINPKFDIKAQKTDAFDLTNQAIAKRFKERHHITNKKLGVLEKLILKFHRKFSKDANKKKKAERLLEKDKIKKEFKSTVTFFGKKFNSDTKTPPTSQQTMLPGTLKSLFISGV